MAGLHSSHPKGSYHFKPAHECHLGVLKLGTFSDVTFIVGPRKEKIPAHQIFLKVRSPVFDVMFSERWNHANNKEVILQDVDPKIFKKFLQYIYADTLEVKVPEALQLLQIADRYDFQMLVSKCEKLLESKVALDDAVDVFQAARKYDKIKLMDKVGAFLATSMSKFQSHPTFSRVDKEFFIYLLKRNDLKIKEVDLFLLALKWAKNQTGFTLEQSLEDILPFIRFPTMTTNEFTKVVIPTGLLSEFSIVELLTYFGSDTETRKSMVSTFKVSTEQRQPVDFAVAIYLRDFDDCKLKQEKYDNLNDRLKFEVSKVRRTVGPFSKLYARLISQPKIALSSISLYCPTPAGDTDQEINPTNTFRIFVEARGSYLENYYEVLTLPDVIARAGTITEVKFPTQVPLDSQQQYRIAVEGERYQRPMIYKVRDFGCIQRSIIAAVGDAWAYLKDIDNDRSRTFGDHYNRAQLIYKLGMEEIS